MLPGIEESIPWYARAQVAFSSDLKVLEQLEMKTEEPYHPPR